MSGKTFSLRPARSGSIGDERCRFIRSLPMAAGQFQLLPSSTARCCVLHRHPAPVFVHALCAIVCTTETLGDQDTNGVGSPASLRIRRALSFVKRGFTYQRMRITPATRLALRGRRRPSIDCSANHGDARASQRRRDHHRWGSRPKAAATPASRAIHPD